MQPTKEPLGQNQPVNQCQLTGRRAICRRSGGLVEYEEGPGGGSMCWCGGEAGPDYDETPSPDIPRLRDLPSTDPQSGSDWQEAAAMHVPRSIEVHQNWLARLFRFKPAKDYLCFTISRKRARQEIVFTLREWRKYGIRDIQVDRSRNVVFARVGPNNYLGMKEVAFAAEIMTVIEHGHRGTPLSIVRFTQERGAASSFHRVIDTIKVVFESRRILVVDKNKANMMIETLRHAPQA